MKLLRDFQIPCLIELEFLPNTVIMHYRKTNSKLCRGFMRMVKSLWKNFLRITWRKLVKKKAIVIVLAKSFVMKSVGNLMCF